MAELLYKVAPNTGWQLGPSGISDASVTSFALVSTTGLPTTTFVLLTIDRVDSSGTKTPSKMERILGQVSGSNIINCTRGVEGTAQAHAGGAVVEIVVSATNVNSIIDAVLEEHNQDGTHNLQDTAFATLNAPRGFLINGKIVPTVASNNLTVALKTLSGSDPSASSPVYVRIGDTIRAATAATSFTLNAGTGWFGSGSSELATKEVDYFSYVIWDSVNSIVKLTAARFPYANAVSDFSATSTAYNYGPNLSATSTDVVEVIGRFAATLSAGAGYTWSVPTYTNSNLVQRPIWETRWLSYTPTATNITIGNGTSAGTYRIALYDMKVKIKFTWGSTTSASGDSSFSVPYTFVNGFLPLGTSVFNDVSPGTLYTGKVWETTSTTIQAIAEISSGTYSQVSGVSSTVPFTWTTSDYQVLDASTRIA